MNKNMNNYKSHSLGPKRTRQKISSRNVELGIEPAASAVGYGVTIVGRNYSKMIAKTKGSQQKDKRPQTRVSEIKISTLIRRLFKHYKVEKETQYNGLINVICDTELLILCYEEMRKSKGSITPGSSSETLDGLNLKWLENLSKDLKSGKYNIPARRVYIPKPGKTTKRPLGVSAPRDKIVQKALQSALEYIYEPKFQDTSHGFRSGRGCHSALRELHLKGAHFSWVVDGDIERCFDSIPHETIRKLISRQIRCDKTHNLLWKSLKAGYVDETGRTVKPNIGTPQWSVVSPTLSNIVLHELDRYMAKLKQRSEKGKTRRVNPAFRKIYRNTQLPVGERRKLLNQTTSKDPKDPNFRRMLYVRYADDFVVLVTASHENCVQLKVRLTRFLKRLGLTLNPEKTKITPLSKGTHFLGADIRKVRNNTKIMKYVQYSANNSSGKVYRSGKQRVNQRLRVLAPIQKLIDGLTQVKLAKRLAGKGAPVPTARRALVPMDHADILAFYNQKIYGLLNYYSFAGNRGQMHRVLYFIIMSCALTLALKFKLRTARATFRKFGRNLADPNTKKELYRPKSLKATHDYKIGQQPEWPEDVIHRSWFNKLTKSGLYKTCALCGAAKVEMHHIRGVKEVRTKIRNADATYAEFSGSFLRKQIPLCTEHHVDYHQGRLSREQLVILTTYR
jgi:group II intron reverse transcriptase/maturase